MVAEDKILEVSDKYEYAIELERKSLFREALGKFTELSGSSDYDSGDIAFHCGWCLENLDPEKTDEIAGYYRISGETAFNIDCRYNSYFRIGWIYHQQKDFTNAAAGFKAAIDLSDSFINGIIQNAAFWYASCLESLGRYIEAIKWYDIVSDNSESLDPESRRRKISCLLNIGLFEEALAVCYSFRNPPPAAFDEKRYSELKKFADKEIKILESNL